ncbi:MAG: FtsX-like permease family protein [Phycisphaerales bacterium]|nr:MAG: FtsX-like permease family protein [Phycisphaerales bacterium]
MSTVRMIFKELWHRKINFLLGVLAVTVAVAFFVAFQTAARASNRETARLMLSMGYNLHVIAWDADVGDFLMTGVANATMPESHLETLASQKNISYNHLLAVLEKQMIWRDVPVLVTGLAPEVCPPGRKKPPMVFQIEPGTAYIGYQVAVRLGIEKGNKIEIDGTQLEVARCLAESGGVDDMRIQCHLADAQQILACPGQISEIQAVDCLCFVEGADPLEMLRTEIGAILPDTQVLQAKSMADARARQRQMVFKTFAVMVPFVVIACGVWVGVLAIMNVRERQTEIGLLRALGYGAAKIGGLFLGKAMLTGLLGALVGFGAGATLALVFGPEIFRLTARTTVRPEAVVLLQSLAAAPLFSIVASFVPVMFAVSYDPAATLREE